VLSLVGKQMFAGFFYARKIIKKTVEDK